MKRFTSWAPQGRCRRQTDCTSTDLHRFRSLHHCCWKIFDPFVLLWNSYCLTTIFLCDVNRAHSTTMNLTCDFVLAAIFSIAFGGFCRMMMMTMNWFRCGIWIWNGILIVNETENETDHVDLSVSSSSTCCCCFFSCVVRIHRIPSPRTRAFCTRLHRVRCSLHRSLKVSTNRLMIVICCRGRERV